MKRVLILCKMPPPYFGTTVWAETLANSDLKNRFNVYFFNNNTHSNLKTVGKISVLRTLKSLLLYFKFTFKVLSFRPHIVLIPFSQSALGFIKDSVFMYLSLLSGNKPLLILHGSNFRNWHKTQTAPLRWYCKRTISNSKGVIVLGNKLRVLFTDWLADEKVFAVPNGLNVNFKEPKSESSKIQITYLGNLQASKGIEDVLRACALLKGKDTFDLNIIGSWRDIKTQQFCEDFATSSKLSVNLHGSLYGQDKLSKLRNSDIFIFPPRMPEGHPLVIVEAMAAGLPIIATDKGAISESVIDGVNGFIVDSNSPEQIASKVQFLIDNPDIRIKMGTESTRIYNERFTEKIMIDNLTEVINRV